jgi:hypothetical protein
MSTGPSRSVIYHSYFFVENVRIFVEKYAYKPRKGSLRQLKSAVMGQRFCHKRVDEGEEMAGERIKETELRTWLSHYVHLFALWVLLIGVGFTATYFARNGDEPVDYAYVLFLASLVVVFLDQLWKIRP